MLPPALILEAYRQGFFPMAQDAHGPKIHWVRPEKRGQLSIPALHIPRSLKKIVLQGGPYRVTVNTAFERVIDSCAAARPERPETWINPAIRNGFIALHVQGLAHCVECWRGDDLVGGLYGLALGGAFFGESMFSHAPNASKIALVHLVARLWVGGFTLLDTQFVNDHLQQFGVYEIPDAVYLPLLQQALGQQGDFALDGRAEQEIVQTYMDFRKSNA